MVQLNALVPLADGFEEMEAVIVIDVLRRAGMHVAVLGLDADRSVTGSRGVVVAHEGELTGTEDCDLLVLPGGAKGAERLAADARIGTLLARCERDERWVGAVCAAPMVLAKFAAFADRSMTSHPSVRELVAAHAMRYLEDSVVVDENLITGRGPGVALQFAVRMVETTLGRQAADAVCKPMMMEHHPNG